MLLLSVSVLWGCPERSICSRLPVVSQNNMPHTLDVQHWPAQNSDTGYTPIYFIAGGPGQSATALAPLLTGYFSDLLEHHDMWFLSPLGTQKHNVFKCTTEGTSLEQLFETSDDITHCLPAENFLPYDYGSESAVHHLEKLRQHNKHDRIILYGISYGTRVAQLYAALYPQYTQALVLDAALPLDIGVIGSSAPAERILHKKIPNTLPLLDSLIGRLPQSIQIYDSEKKGDITITITTDSLKFMIHSLLYTPLNQDRLEKNLEHALKDNWKPLVHDFVGTMDLSISMGVYFSAFCSEDFPFIKARETFFPFATHMNKYCSQWPRYTYTRSHKVPSHIPMLILSGKWDPISPPEYSSLLNQQGEHRHWLMWPNQAHVVSLFPCAQKAIAAFLQKVPLSFVLKKECSAIEYH